MPDPSNSSFIPKRGPTRQRRRSSSRQIYLFTLVCYVLMFASLIGSGGVYLYLKHVETVRQNSITELSKEVEAFKISNMQRVLDFDRRLKQASSRLQNSVEIASVLRVLEIATIDTVQFDSLSVQRNNDTDFLLAAQIRTDSFDSTISQRGEYKRRDSKIEVTILDVTANNLDGTMVDGKLTKVITNETDDESIPLVSFVAEVRVPVNMVLLDPDSTPSEIINQLPPPQEVEVEEPVTSVDDEAGLNDEEL